MGNTILQYVLYVVILVALAIPLGGYIGKIMNGEKVWLSKILSPVEGLVYNCLLYTSYGIKKAIQECGYRIPEDISLAGYDDVFYHLIADKPLTTVHQDLDSMAANTVNLLMQKMNKDFQPKQPVQHLIRPSLVAVSYTHLSRPSSTLL